MCYGSFHENKGTQAKNWPNGWWCDFGLQKVDHTKKTVRRGTGVPEFENHDPLEDRQAPLIPYFKWPKKEEECAALIAQHGSAASVHSTQNGIASMDVSG